ncbi:hypothetical protein EVAR_51687_1 [Eumeta japonica]|uniref:Uncharacterized protein n=1 Tax=Eumeta variegata TaxID=151549 RepID=A0A4C1Y5Y1_EUMVA|nr:hypothetical protein EVAR_51687_1 [Eumeta japonica]
MARAIGRRGDLVLDTSTRPRLHFVKAEMITLERAKQRVKNGSIAGSSSFFIEHDLRLLHLIDGEKVDQVKEFIYLVSLLTNDGKYNKDIERRVNTGNNVNGALLDIMNSKSVSQRALLSIVAWMAVTVYSTYLSIRLEDNIGRSAL